MKNLRDMVKTVVDTLKIITVEPYLFLCLFGYTVRLASFQSLLMERACTNLYYFGDEICNDLDSHPVEQAKAMEAGNNLYMAVMLLSSLPSIVVAIFLGPWSDKYSRRYPLIISSTGMMLEGLCCAILTAFSHVSPLLYAVTAVFSGLTGGFLISASSSFSYMADITDERSRPARYAMLEFSTILAVVAGNAVGGQLFKFGYLPVMVCAPVALAMASLYSIFVVKETKPPVPAEKRREMVRDLFQCDNVKNSFITCTKKRPGNLRCQLWTLMWCSCSLRFVDMGIISIAFPFARRMYKWDVSIYSNASIAFSVATAAMTIFGVPILSRKLKLHEAALGAIGVLSLMSKMILISVANEEWVFYFAWMAGTLKSFGSIAIRSRLSKVVPRSESGRAFSLLATCESMTPLLGTVVFIQIYNAVVLIYPGLPFATSAVFLIPSLCIFVWMMKMPTVSLAEFAIADEQASVEKQLQTISSIDKQPETASTSYSVLKEEK